MNKFAILYFGFIIIKAFIPLTNTEMYALCNNTDWSNPINNSYNTEAGMQRFNARSNCYDDPHIFQRIRPFRWGIL